MIKKALSSQFLVNSALMISGSAAAQLITIALSPIITRLYAPEDLGKLALYTAIVSLLAVLATGQYQSAIMLPKKDSYARQIAYMALGLSMLFSAALFVAMLLFGSAINTGLADKSLGYALYLIPLGVLAMGCFATLSMWFSRAKKFKGLSLGHVGMSIANNATSIAIGFKTITSNGVIIGHVTGQVMAASYLLVKFVKERRYSINKLHIYALMKRYKKFPLVTLPHSLFSTLSLHLPSLLLIGLYSPVIAGIYFLANRVANVPISILSQSLHQVLFEAFSREKAVAPLYRKRFWQMNMTFLPLFALLWFIAPMLFAFVFGEDWGEAGEYVRVIVPLFYCKFMSNLFTTPIYFLYERQGENFVFSVLIVLSAALSLIYGGLQDDIILGLALMTWSNISFIIMKLCRSWSFVHSGENKN